MKAVIFVKQSERLPGKHLMAICGQPMIKRIYDALDQTGLFEETVIYSKYPNLVVDGCKIERDNTEGTLLDSILEAILKYGEFLAVGGDLPLLNREILFNIVIKYHKVPVVAIDKDGTVEPLFAIYNDSVYDDLLKFSRNSKKIFEFVDKRFQHIILNEEFSSRLLNVNTIEDLYTARKMAGCTDE